MIEFIDSISLLEGFEFRCQHQDIRNVKITIFHESSVPRRSSTWTKNGNLTKPGLDFYRFHCFHKRFAMFWTEMSKPTSRRKRFSQKPSDVALELGPLTFDPWVAKGTWPLTRDLLGSGPEPWQWCLHPELDPGTWAMSLDLWPQTSCLMKMHWIHLRSYELQFEM